MWNVPGLTAVSGVSYQPTFQRPSPSTGFKSTDVSVTASVSTGFKSTDVSETVSVSINRFQINRHFRDRLHLNRFQINRRFRDRLRLHHQVSNQPTFQRKLPSPSSGSDINDFRFFWRCVFRLRCVTVHGHAVCQLSGLQLRYGIMQYSQYTRTFPSLGWTPHDYCCPLWTLCWISWQQPSTSTGFHAVMQLQLAVPRGC